jgi:hypothetical protein
MINLKMSTIEACLRINVIRKGKVTTDLLEAVQIAKESTSDSAAHDYEEATSVFQSGLSQLMSDSMQDQILEIVTHLTNSNDYPWKQFAHRGRQWVLERLSPNEFQSFKAAGLTEIEMTDEIREWWDCLTTNIKTGSSDFSFREWEKRSFELEKKRLASEGCPLSCQWVALEDNFIGYDILTYQKTLNGWQKHYVEVKSSETGIFRFHLSYREAAIAIRFPNDYSLHFWDTKSETLSELSGMDLLAHLPLDQGQGKWQEVLVTLT